MEFRGTCVGNCALATVWTSCPIISCCVRRYVDDVISRIGRMFPDMTIELFRPNGNSAVLLVSTHVCSKCQQNPSVCSGPFSVATQGQRFSYSQRPNLPYCYLQPGGGGTLACLLLFHFYGFPVFLYASVSSTCIFCSTCGGNVVFFKCAVWITWI